jgi:hypothetical protein
MSGLLVKFLVFRTPVLGVLLKNKPSNREAAVIEHPLGCRAIGLKTTEAQGTSSTNPNYKGRNG